MDSPSNEGGSSEKNTANSNMKQEFSKDEDKSSGPTVLFFWIWNWFATLPKTVTNLYADLKSGELIAKFSLLDAMLQFIFAVATSCHPQEDHEIEGDEQKVNGETHTSSNSNDFKAFGGNGRTLRSRTVAANS